MPSWRVVKKGVNSRAPTSGGIPVPTSVTANSIQPLCWLEAARRTRLTPHFGLNEVLLVDIKEIGSPFDHVGITGYPESHPTIDDDVTVQSMWDKRRYATHIVSNMTFDAEHLGTWAERIRRRGVTLPLLVGVPGPVERTKLLGMATKIGVGESLRFLRKQKSVFARIAAPGFSTDRFVSRVAALSANPALGIEGLHVFTFNQVEVVEAWRQRMLEEAASARVRPPG